MMAHHVRVLFVTIGGLLFLSASASAQSREVTLSIPRGLDSVSRLQSRGDFGGFYALRNTLTRQDRDSELERLAERYFQRIAGSGDTWHDVCGIAGAQDNHIPPVYCRTVLDWEGRTFSCNDRNTGDGTRMALCTLNLAPGYYAYRYTRTSQDRDDELRNHARGRLRRLAGPTRWRPNSFARLCANIGRTCEYVVDWEGRRHPCTADAADGTRMAYCR